MTYPLLRKGGYNNSDNVYVDTLPQDDPKTTNRWPLCVTEAPNNRVV